MCEFKGFYKGGVSLDFETKIRGVNLVSGEKLLDFEIICLPAHADQHLCCLSSVIENFCSKLK